MTRRGVVLIAAVVVVAVAAVLVVVLKPFGGSQPEETTKYVIAVDAGHGGYDPGATADGVLEKDINLEIANKLTALIDAQPDLVAKQIRKQDLFIPLADRITQAEDAGAMMYVVVHVNSYGTDEPEGVETLVDNTREPGDDFWALAELIQDGVVNATGANDRGARAQDLYLQHATIPAVSVETGYITNPAERAKLVDPEYQQRIAQGILDGIRQFIEWKYPADTTEE
jgi:N-acetylmuramoyl-L-alanine amidase